DLIVTGVQTCALPISAAGARSYYNPPKRNQSPFDEKVSIMVQHIYLVRHGDTKLNDAGVIRGWKDVPLSPEGVKAAKRVAKQLRSEERRVGKESRAKW